MRDGVSDYLELMKKVLINSIYRDTHLGREPNMPYDPELREQGKDWPHQAHTMIGLKRLTNIQNIVFHIENEGIDGDFIETGVWRGGASIFMKACLKDWNDTERKIYVCDSFQGLPFPECEQDKDLLLHRYQIMEVSKETVIENFKRYNLYDDNVIIVEGWFDIMLPYLVANIESNFSLIRLDGDMYKSTMDSIRPLYPRLNVGGFIIIDEYFDMHQCKEAVDTYREKNKITEPIIQIDHSGGYWRKER